MIRDRTEKKQKPPAKLLVSGKKSLSISYFSTFSHINETSKMCTVQDLQNMKRKNWELNEISGVRMGV